MSSLCQICDKEPPKYRCPSCGTSSCSLRCSQAHKTGCTQEQPAGEADFGLPRKKESFEEEVQGPPQLPFDSPIAHDEVRQLFKKHPRLQYQLRQIYQRTLEPDHVDRPNAARRRGSSYRNQGRESHVHDRNDVRRWTPDRGFQRGLDFLQTEEQSISPDAGGLKEFSAWMSQRYPVEARQASSPDGDESLVT